jgi:hypothetical protein
MHGIDVHMSVLEEVAEAFGFPNIVAYLSQLEAEGPALLRRLPGMQDAERLKHTC